jgi:GntR family transcriptional regulator
MVEFTRGEGIPLYVWIREALRGEISQGVLKFGQRLLSEDELAARFGVSRMTVRQGIAELIDEGLLYRRHGVGTFVAYPHLERDHTHLTNFFDAASSEGFEARATLLLQDVTPSRQKVARALCIQPGDLVIRVKTLRYANNVPLAVHDAHLPHKLFAKILTNDLDIQNLWSLFEQCGFKVKRAIQRIEAREASRDLAKLMKIREGAPILYKERTVYSENGTPVEFTYCFNRGDIYSLTVSLER